MAAQRLPDEMQALLIEYDAATSHDRRELLSREGLSMRDVARWRRELARRAEASEPAPADDDQPLGGDDESQAVEPVAPPEQPDAPAAQTAPPPMLKAAEALVAHADAVAYHANALLQLAAETPANPTGRRRTQALTRLLRSARESAAAAREVSLSLANETEVERPDRPAERDPGRPTRGPWWGRDEAPDSD